jgi:hypothetical protein
MPVNQYIITEEELNLINDDFPITAMRIRSHPYQSEREKVLDELIDGLQEFPFSQNQKIHDLTRCVLCGKHFKSSELGLRVAAGWIHNNPDKCKQEKACRTPAAGR